MCRKIALIVSFIIIHIALHGKTYYFEKKSPEAGFAFDGVMTIQEDYNGLIWFGCSNGLYNYNTQTFKHYLSKEEQTNTLSDNYINKIYLDKKRQLWICTRNGLCKYNRQTNDFTRINLNTSIVKTLNHDVTNILQANDSIYLCIINEHLYQYNTKGEQPKLSPLLDNQNLDLRCKTIIKDKNNKIWIGLYGGNILTTDSSVKEIIRWGAFRENPITTICVRKNDVWIGYIDQGIDKADINGNLLQHYGINEPAPFNLLSNSIYKIKSLYNGEIWIGTFKGINIINDNDNIAITANIFNNLPHNSVRDILEDKNYGVWVSTWGGGLAHYSKYNYYFRHIKRIPFHSEIARNIISSIAEDEKGIIYLGSENDGLKTYNTSNGDVKSIKVYNKYGELINIKSIAIDKNQTIWLGTFNNGLWYKKYNEQKFRKENHPFLNQMKLIHKIIPSNGKLWICSHGKGVAHYDPNNKSLQNFKSNIHNQMGLLTNKIRSLIIDERKNIIIATEKGLCIKTPADSIFKNLGETDESYNTAVNAICKTDHGETWVGTKNKGILVLDTVTNTCKTLDRSWNNDLVEVFSILNDQTGNIWIASNLGIQMYNPRTDNIYYFNEKDGVLGRNFSPNTALCSKNGSLFFGGYNGFNIIDPNNITLNPFKPDILFSDILINNVSYQESSIEQFKNKNINEIKELELKHTENTLSFNFVANNYIKSYKNQFKYRLVNYQDDWINLNTKSEIFFTKIPHGRYQLEIIGSNNNDIWCNEALTLPIRIKPPFWLTWYAFVIYALFLVTIGYLVITALYYRVSMKKKLLIERLEHEADEELFKNKQKFFMNISHELRTPLTLILSPINFLIQRFKYDSKTSEHLWVVQRNADRLLRLTNEILDFRLIETGKTKFKPKQTDIIDICKNVFDCYTFEAVEREINFIFSSCFEKLEIEIDPNKIEKIIFNLLSNAFKYSENNSNILLTVESSIKTTNDYRGIFYTGNVFEGNTLEIRVKNYGQIIPEDELPVIFERFSTKSIIQSAGTGLGLHISSEFIQLHEGNISVISTEKEGTTFSVNLPLKETRGVKKNFVVQKEAKDIALNQSFDDDVMLPNLQSDIVILIVEDNIDLKIYLKKTLEKRYKVLTASNGIQGYEIAQEITPDLIISDVKMPGMDGATMTKKLKQNDKTSIIPIILLTAMADKMDQIKGIEQGADSYLVKPVEVDLLFAHIQNLLDSRKEISHQLTQRNAQEKESSSSTNKRLSFIEKVETIILDNLLNSEFNVSILAEQLAVSRSSLHRKVKRESGQSVTEFVRDIRMKKAVDLMKENKYNLEEIGTYAGFNSHSYFARTFKSKYGKTPKDFYSDIKTNKGS